MFNIEQCRKYLIGTYPDEKITEIRDNLYQVCSILVENYFTQRAVAFGT